MKHHPASPNPPHAIGRRGFALVVTLTLMVLLAILALGLLSLSAVSMRTSKVGADRDIARANARMALMIALGELQASMGPDQRVSAPSDSVIDSPARPHLTGVWDAWRWDPSTSSSPDYSQKKDLFRRWLISSPDESDTERFTYPRSAPENGSVELVGNLGNNGVSNSVRAAKVPIHDPARRGAYAWAVFDESVKAAIHLTPPPTEGSPAEMAASRNTPARFRADILDAKLASLDGAANLVSLDTAILPVGRDHGDEIQKRFHDFTTVSYGLLTDTAHGGLKLDLTQLFEATPFPGDAFPSPGPYASADGATTWKYLYDHYRKYKDLASTGEGTPMFAHTAAQQKLSATGQAASPDEEKLLPVIARLQLVFSIVSHHAHIHDRVNFLNNSGVPKGNDKHAVPHLAYDPVITLYNPYDVAISLDKIRVRVWDPPVGFRFIKKDNEKGTSAYLRPEMANGEFHGLARLGIENEKNTSARKFFTLLLTDKGSSSPGNPVELQPGEVRVFSPWVNDDWTWGWETASQYNVKAFFDFAASKDFGNRDARTSNNLGIECVPGWDPRAGLQTDHLAYGARSAESLYDFEKVAGAKVGGFPSLRLDDEITVELKALRTLPSGSPNPDFMVELLAGKVNDYADTADAKYNNPRDLLRRYKLRFKDATAEISANPDQPVISRTYRNSDLLQLPNTVGLGGKKCLAMLEMAIHTTMDAYDESKAWLYNNPVVEGAEQDHSLVGATNQSYDLRLVELSGWSTFPIVEWNPTPGPDFGKSYYGAGRTSFEGVGNVPMHHVSIAPAASLGDFIPANLYSGATLPRVIHPFGNSRAHPLIPSGEVSRLLNGRTLLDHSYLLNDALWDSYFFSTVTGYDPGFSSGNRTRREVLDGIFNHTQPTLNRRIVAASGMENSSKANELDTMDDTVRAKTIAANLSVAGAFNLNSTSVEAWRALLSSQRDQAVNAWKNRRTENAGKTPFVRTSFPIHSPSDPHDTIQGKPGWDAYRTLDDSRISDLATAIVAEIKKRGIEDKAPPLSLGEFVNRRPGTPTALHSLGGIIQTAIDTSGINAAQLAENSKPLKSSDISNHRKRGAVLTEVMNGHSAEGSPPIITQGDILGPIVAVATVRGDTFKIRAYGEALSQDGKTVLATAYCEAVVQRSPIFIDPKDAPETAMASLGSQANRDFGRRFQILSFRWVDKPES
jgi:hypothetical protein